VLWYSKSSANIESLPLLPRYFRIMGYSLLVSSPWTNRNTIRAQRDRRPPLLISQVLRSARRDDRDAKIILNPCIQETEVLQFYYYYWSRGVECAKYYRRVIHIEDYVYREMLRRATPRKVHKRKFLRAASCHSSRRNTSRTSINGPRFVLLDTPAKGHSPPALKERYGLL
jgi:hypothetical protein